MSKIGQNSGKIANDPPQCSAKIGTPANNNIGPGAPGPLNSIFASQFKRITWKKRRVFALEVAISGPHLAFL